MNQCFNLLQEAINLVVFQGHMLCDCSRFPSVKPQTLSRTLILIFNAPHQCSTIILSLSASFTLAKSIVMSPNAFFKRIQQSTSGSHMHIEWSRTQAGVEVLWLVSEQERRQKVPAFSVSNTTDTRLLMITPMINKDSCKNSCVQVCECALTYAHGHAHARTHECMHACTCARTHARMHAGMQAGIGAHAHEWRVK